MTLSRRTALKRTPWRPKRRALAPRSARKVAADEAKPEVRAKVFKRDNYRCVMAGRVELGGSCIGPITPHHLQKASQGGAYVVGNLVTLCVHHNDAAEDLPNRAWRLGLVARNGDTLDDCWRRMRANGLVAW